MKANKVWLFSDLIEKNKRVFKVPVYQRNYDWTNVQCEKLYSDIIKAWKDDVHHFTGTIVYVEDVNGGSGLNEVLIIDGQQRITTIYILLKALLDLSKGNSDRVESEVTDVMFNRNCDEEYKVKLKPVQTDNNQLMYLIQDKVEKMDRTTNVYKSYITFKKLIQNSLENGFELKDILFGIKKLEVVEIILDKHQGDMPQKIFESINSTGLDLSLADLIRNYLRMDEDNQDYLYQEYWLDIEKNVGYKNLGDFFINYINSQVTKAVNSKNAYTLFKETCEVNSYSNEDVLKKLKRTSKYYGVFIGENISYSKEIQRLLVSFNMIKQTTVLPFIFNIFDDFEDGKIKEEELINILEYTLTYLIRNTTCESTKNLSKFMKSLYTRAFSECKENCFKKFVSFLNNLKANDRMPDDKEFFEALIYKPIYKKSICKYVLSSIENSTKETINTDNLTIEHILPQKENAVLWKKSLGEEYSKVYEVYLHTLGNLTFTGYNSELGTKSFSEKKRIIRENSKATILNKCVLSANDWNEDAILTRAKNLAELVVKKFKYIEIDKDVDEKNNLYYNLTEKIDYRGTKPREFSLIGEYTKVTSWKDLLSKFIILTFNMDKSIYNEFANSDFSIENATRAYITHDNRKLRDGIEIENSGIYYESNLSANNIVSFIKSIVLKMNLELDDLNIYLK